MTNTITMKKIVSTLLLAVLIVNGCRQSTKQESESSFTHFTQQSDWIGTYNFYGICNLTKYGKEENSGYYEITITKDTCTFWGISPDFYFSYLCTAAFATDKLHLFFLKKFGDEGLPYKYTQQDTLLTLIRKREGYYIRSPFFGNERKYNIEVQAEKGSKVIY